MKISFLDFWGGFDPNNNFFTHLIRSIKENVEVVDAKDADIIIYSCFGHDHYFYNHCKKIFYTGENIRPNFSECNYSLSFDFDSYNGRNIRLPLWYLYIDWFNVKSYGNPEWLIPESYLYGENEFTQKKKTDFCSIVFSHPTKERLELIEKLSKYKPVTMYGKSGGRFLTEGEKTKLDVISNSKFSICVENSIYPGYYTEKLLHAKIAGTIPIYYADENFGKDFNKNCCINLCDYNSVDEMVDYIIQFDEKFEKLQEPLFYEQINLNEIKNSIMDIL